MMGAPLDPAAARCGREAGTPEPGAAEARALDYAVDYEGWSRVAISMRGGDAGRFILTHTGLWTWQLAARELPQPVLDAD